MSDPIEPSGQPVVGFVGLGQIGAPMAERLLGWPGGLVVHDVASAATEPFAAAGAIVAPTVGDLAAQARLISVMVRDDEQVCTVVDQILADAAEGTIVAIHSTIRAETAEALAAAAMDQGVEIVDAPVSGGAMGAADGTLAVLVGGTPEAVERCRVPFAAFADLVVHFGPVGSGTKAKLARNLLHFVSFTATAEAQRLAEAAGLDLEALGRVVRHSDAVTGGAGAVMLRKTTEPTRPDEFWRKVFTHATALGEKDLDLALALGRDLGVDLPMARFARANLAAALGVPHEVEEDQ